MEELRKTLKKYKWDSILISVLTVVLGILCVALPTSSGYILCIFFGAALIAIGVAMFIQFCAYGVLFGTRFIITALTCIVLGILFIVYTDMMQGVLTILFGLYIIIDSAYAIAESIECARWHVSGWIAMLILAIVTLGLGVAVMFSSFETVMIFAGTSLIIEGIRRLVITLTFSGKIRKARKEYKDIYGYTDKD